MSEEITVEITFRYVTERVPDGANQTSVQSTHIMPVRLKLAHIYLNSDGTPMPLPLWHAERMFLENFDNKHSPKARLLQWQAFVGEKLVSEYKVMLPAGQL